MVPWPLEVPSCWGFGCPEPQCPGPTSSGAPCNYILASRGAVTPPHPWSTLRALQGSGPQILTTTEILGVILLSVSICTPNFSSVSTPFLESGKIKELGCLFYLDKNGKHRKNNECNWMSGLQCRIKPRQPQVCSVTSLINVKESDTFFWKQVSKESNSWLTLQTYHW